MANASVQNYKARLNKIVPSVRIAVTSELIKGAQVMVAAMKNAAPEEEGDLRNSIRYSRENRIMSVTVRAGGPLTTVDGFDYSHAIEHGTSEMREQPFFWPIYRLFKKQIRTKTLNAMRKAIKKAYGTS